MWPWLATKQNMSSIYSWIAGTHIAQDKQMVVMNNISPTKSSQALKEYAATFSKYLVITRLKNLLQCHTHTCSLLWRS